MPYPLFVTGKLAAPSLETTLAGLEEYLSFEILVLDITVAALMNTGFLCRNLPPCQGYSEVVLPGLCRVDVEILSHSLGVPVRLGPKDLKDLPAFYGRDYPEDEEHLDLQHPQILAEIVDAPYMATGEILERSRYYRDQGADIIDLGCCVEKDFPHLEEVVTLLKEEGFKISLDSFKEEEILRGCGAGIDLLLSLNSSNMTLASQLNCPAVIIPDFGQGLESLESNLFAAREEGLDCVVDPVLDPLNFGFTPSLERFIAARRKYPDLPFLMGIGNVTELTDADSTGINALLLGIAFDLNIDYLLTTEASHRTRGAVREAALARRLLAKARKRGTPPKNLDENLITVKDRRVETYKPEELKEIQALVKDRNFRIFVANGRIFVFNRNLFLSGTTADELFPLLKVTDPGHAFYLGRELYKAQLALNLGKKYIQEEELSWGYLSDQE